MTSTISCAWLPCASFPISAHDYWEAPKNYLCKGDRALSDTILYSIYGWALEARMSLSSMLTRKSVSSGFATHKIEQQSLVAESLPLSVNLSPTWRPCSQAATCLFSLLAADTIALADTISSAQSVQTTCVQWTQTPCNVYCWALHCKQYAFSNNSIRNMVICVGKTAKQHWAVYGLLQQLLRRLCPKRECWTTNVLMIRMRGEQSNTCWPTFNERAAIATAPTSWKLEQIVIETNY